MKTKTILLALMAVVLSVGFSACGDDEIAPSNGGNTGNGEPSPQEQVASVSVTGGVYDIGAASATFVGYVNLSPSELTTATFGFIWGTEENLKWDNKAGYATSRDLETNKYSVTANSLNIEALHFYRSYVCLNGNTYVYGNIKSFTTQDLNLQTDETDNIGLMYAELSAHANLSYPSYERYFTTYDIEHYSDYGFIWGTEADLNWENKMSLTSYKFGGSPSHEKEIYTMKATRLSPNTKYYYRAFFYLNDKLYLGDVKSFTTKALQIELQTGEASDIKQTFATLSASVQQFSSELSESSLRIIWGTNEELLWENKISYAKCTDLHNNYYFSVMAKELTPNTKYYYRVCFLIDSKYIYGDVKSFTTRKPEKAPYAVWCTNNEIRYDIFSDNETLYFTYCDDIIEETRKYNGQNIRFLWKGDDIVAQSSNKPVWEDFIREVTHVVIEDSFSGIKPSNLNSWFKDAYHLSAIDGLEYLNISEATNMSSMFSGCSSLTSLDLSHFNTQNVTNMSSMFSGCNSLTSLDVSHFNTQNVTNMNSMFSGCRNLTSLDVSHFDTQKVESMAGMFSGCSKLTSLDVSHFNTQNVTNMSSMFSGCNSLTSLDVSHFDTQKVESMAGMFSGCSKLTSLDVSHFNTQNVTNMSSMFSGCNSLTSLDVSHFNTQNVTGMGSMFSGCFSLTSLDVSHFDTQNVTYMGFMFSGCRNLTSLDVSHFDTQNVTYMNSMFEECFRLTSLDVDHFDTQKVTHMGSMFSGCSKLKTIFCNDKWSCQNSNYMFSGCISLVGAIKYNGNKTDATYANPDTGYFTRK